MNQKLTPKTTIVQYLNLAFSWGYSLGAQNFPSTEIMEQFNKSKLLELITARNSTKLLQDLDDWVTETENVPDIEALLKLKYNVDLDSMVGWRHLGVYGMADLALNDPYLYTQIHNKIHAKINTTPLTEESNTGS